MYGSQFPRLDKKTIKINSYFSVCGSFLLQFMRCPGGYLMNWVELERFQFYHSSLSTLVFGGPRDWLWKSKFPERERWNYLRTVFFLRQQCHIRTSTAETASKINNVSNCFCSTGAILKLVLVNNAIFQVFSIVWDERRQRI